ncbi:MAG: hypothetical protein WC241_01120 [Candidatus Paceibacterota bacterium]|jgi:hypothetical protein
MPDKITDLSLQRFTGGYFKFVQYFANDEPIIFGGIINRVHFQNGNLKIIHFCSGSEIEINISSYEFLDLPKTGIRFLSADYGHDLILIDTSVN